MLIDHPSRFSMDHRAPFFWVKRDTSPGRRLIAGSISVEVPYRLQRDILASSAEDWFFDNIWEGVLAEWSGTDLILHFATARDAGLFQLVWA